MSHSLMSVGIAAMALWSAQVLVHAEIELGFTIGRDNPAVLNGHDGYIAVGAFPFGLIGERSGVCQGIAGLAAGFKKHAIFLPSQPAPTRYVAEDTIDAVYAFYRAGCPLQVEIGGSRGLYDFSRQHSEFFRMRVVDMNLSIAKDQILAVLGEFVALRDPTAIKARVRETLHSLRDALEQGRRPLLLYRSHVVLVHALDRAESKESGRMEYRVVAYDPNPRTDVEYRIAVDPRTDLPLEVPPRGPLWDVSADTVTDARHCAELAHQYAHVLPERFRPRVPEPWSPF